MDTKETDPAADALGNRSRSYVLSGKMMLCAVVILFFVVILMVFLHLYARWRLLRARRRYLRRRSRNRRPQTLFYVNRISVPVLATRGLSVSVVKSLPVFTFSAATHPDPIECPVCLSEFEENEAGRVLPNCKHSFHVDCIDTWFHSHSTCPLCRSPVKPVAVGREISADVAVRIHDPAGSSSGLHDTCRDGADEAGTSSSGGCRIKPAAIEVPRRNTEAFEDELNRSDSSSNRSFMSPVSRVLSFKRILSRERRIVPSPFAGSSVGSPSACVAWVTDPDTEHGSEQITESRLTGDGNALGTRG